MKTLIIVLLAGSFNHQEIFGYGGPPPPPPFYYAETFRSIYQHPVNTTFDGESALFAQLTYTTVTEIEGKIDLEGTSTDVNGTIDGKNFKWELPESGLRLGFAPALSRDVSLLLMLMIDNPRGFALGTGCDFTISRTENHNTRLGFGAYFYKKEFFWTFSSDGSGISDVGWEFDPYIHLTYSSSFDDWIVNPFIRLSYSRQTFMDVKEYSTNVSSSINVYTLTPGLSYKPGGNVVISLGSYVSYVPGIELAGNYHITPFLQMSLLINRKKE